MKLIIWNLINEKPLKIIQREASYIHHAGVVYVYPESNLLLMGKLLQVNRLKFPKKESENTDHEYNL